MLATIPRKAAVLRPLRPTLSDPALSASTFAPGAPAGTLVGMITGVPFGARPTFAPASTADVGKFQVTGSATAGWRLEVALGSPTYTAVPGRLRYIYKDVIMSASVILRADPTFALPVPRLLEGFDAGGFGTLGTLSHATVTTPKVQGTGAEKVTATGVVGTANTFGLTKTYGSDNVSTMGLVVLNWNRETASTTMTGGAVFLTLYSGATNTALAIGPNDASYLGGGRFLAAHCSKWTAPYAAGAGVLQAREFVQQVAAASGNVTGYFDGLYCNANGVPRLIIEFDDGYLDTFNNAYPVLRARNLIASLNVPPGLLGLGGKMAVAHALELYFDGGWDMLNDGWDDVKVSSQTLAGYLASVDKTDAFLAYFKMERGRKHICFPNADFNEAVVAELLARGYQTARGSGTGHTFYSRMGIGPGVRMAMPWKGAYSNQILTVMKAFVDQVVQEGTNGIIVHHDVSDAPSSNGTNLTTVFTPLYDYVAGLRDAGLIEVTTRARVWAADGAAVAA